MKKLVLSFAVLLLLFIVCTKPSSNKEEVKLLIRCDDIGMCHSVNMAIKRLIELDIPFSVSVMFVCPWYQEAVDLLKDNPQISVGVHATFNSEWAYYKWGPVSGKESVHVDS